LLPTARARGLRSVTTIPVCRPRDSSSLAGTSNSRPQSVVSYEGQHNPLPHFSTPAAILRFVNNSASRISMFSGWTTRQPRALVRHARTRHLFVQHRSDSSVSIAATSPARVCQNLLPSPAQAPSVFPPGIIIFPPTPQSFRRGRPTIRAGNVWTPG